MQVLMFRECETEREGVRSEKDCIFDGAGSWIARAKRIKIIREK